MAARCAQQYGAITRVQTRTAGLSRGMLDRRLRTGRLFEIHPGVYGLTPTLEVDGRRAAALLWSGGALGYESVLHLYELCPEPDAVHVICPTGRAAPDGVRVHRSRALPPRDIRYVRRLRATTVARALLDVAPRTPPDRLRGLVHEAQYRRLVDPRSLAVILGSHPGHPGLRALGAIDPAPRHAESRLETRLYRALALVPDPPPERQYWITLASGRRIRADAAYVEERVLIEADGRSAHARMLAFEADRERDNDAAVVGWLTLRYPAVKLRAPDRVADEVQRVLVVRGRR